MGKDHTSGPELKNSKAQDKLNTHYFTNGALASTTNLNLIKND
jgi:hypothetical protein